jgi:xanthine dehydrogenase large subunit
MNAPDGPKAALPLRPAGALGESVAHDSAHLHVSGRANYIDDLPEQPGTLHAAFGLASCAYGAIKALDLSGVLAVKGVKAVLTNDDLKHATHFGPVKHDDCLFADGKVEFWGQPLFAVAAASHDLARAAVRAAQVRYGLMTAVIDPRDSKDAVVPSRTIEIGDPSALERAPQRIEGSVSCGEQEHFYLEGQVAYCLPLEDGALHLYVSTQHPSEMQHIVAEILGLPQHKLTVEARRIGGGFGGKESQSHWTAIAAALLCRKTGQPVKMRLDRDDDFLITGKRHAFDISYAAGFEKSSRVIAHQTHHLVTAGYSADFTGPVADRALFHAHSGYHFDNARISSTRAKTHTQSATAFRGFGGPQGMLGVETMLDDVAIALGIDALDVRYANLHAATLPVTHYGQEVHDYVLPDLMRQLEARSDYRARRKQIAAFNAGSSVLKRGLALTPVMFGISFGATFHNQATALLHLYKDGSLAISHGGIEMGQGLHMKVLQTVADQFAVPAQQVRLLSTDTSRVANMPATAASSGADLNCAAALDACRQLRARLLPLAARLLDASVEEMAFFCGRVGSKDKSLTLGELAQQAYLARVSISAQGYYATPKIGYDFAHFHGRPFFYYSYGASVSEALIDTLTGESRITRVDILQDAGRSMNPAIDRGQIEGGFVQGLGWLTTEEIVRAKDGLQAGKLLTHAPQTYKIPTSRDVPHDFRVDFYAGSNVEDTVYKSKAVGEPPLMLAISAFLALRNAVAACGNAGRAPTLRAPATPEAIMNAIDSVL